MHGSSNDVLSSRPGQLVSEHFQVRTMELDANMRYLLQGSHGSDS